MPVVREGKDRLATVALAAGDGGDRSGGSDGRLGGVADPVEPHPLHDGMPIERRPAEVLNVGGERRRRRPAQVVRIVQAAPDGDERPALFGQLDARLHAVEPDELHHLGGKLERLVRPIAHPDVVHDVAQAHDAEPDAPGPQGGFAERGNGRDVGVGRHHVVQETRRQRHRTPQVFPVHRCTRRQVLCQIDRPEAAVLVRAQPLLAARIGGFQVVQVGYGVGPIGGVEEQHAGLAVAVRVAHHEIEDLPRPDGLHHLPRVRRHQVVGLVVAHGLHEGVGNADGNVEVRDLVLVGLARDEVADIGMIDAQHGHVRPAPCAALGHFAEGLVVDAQEPDRTGGQPGGGLDDGAFLAQAAEGEAVAASRLLNQSRVAESLEDAGRIPAHIVGDRQHEAGRQLPQRRAGAGERRRIRKEGLRGEQLVELQRDRQDVPAPLALGLGDVPGDAPEHVFDGLDRGTVGTSAQVTLGQHRTGVFAQLHLAETLGARRAGRPLNRFWGANVRPGGLQHRLSSEVPRTCDPRRADPPARPDRPQCTCCTVPAVSARWTGASRSERGVLPGGRTPAGAQEQPRRPGGLGPRRGARERSTF